MARPALVLLLVLAAGPALGQASAGGFDARTEPTPPPIERAYDVDAAPAYYVTAPEVALRAAPDDRAAVVLTLRVRDGVRVLGDEAGGAGWRLVQYGPDRGYVRAEAISNVWVRVDKSDRTVYVYRGDRLVRELPADVSRSDEDKVRRSARGEADHYRVPEGVFFVCRKNDASQYYRAFVVSYPNPVHALRGLERGLITQAQYEAIVDADREGREPPMGTRLGGLIEIHGNGSGRRRAWTRGCVALRNVHMDELWAYVEVGTPIVIEP
ncbi:L,D-transpeptidase family protein [Rubrivirga sp. S365]|uniref:L,D-transpeptidase family protein n=1 Tax=Rubrivirga litoralis TaxID=3075598 RepID=A0ABU3BS42_9BACT|nr:MULTISPECIES: L,D-transpeptidase family protein [unclassified Rubrivirga]MDT0632094.1 L,D-transpeptidase family protein [Rubrivirga sp. F394]MDT7856173.1 L,D-transpeptidase family protein [Rubrivirga sp. S365]